MLHRIEMNVNAAAICVVRYTSDRLSLHISNDSAALMIM